MKLAPVASLYSIGAVLMSACLKYQLVDGLRKSKMTMSYRLVKNSQEYWRVGTGMFIFDLESPLDICTLVALFSSLSALERRFFKGSPSGMITTLAFIASLLLAPGFYIRDLRLKDPAMMMYIAIVTWATLRCFFRPTAGGRAVAAALTPLVPIIAPHLRKGALDIALVKHQGMAIAAGLVCVLLIPDTEGARALRQQRQKAASKKAKEAKGGEGGGGGGWGYRRHRSTSRAAARRKRRRSRRGTAVRGRRRRRIASKEGV